MSGPVGACLARPGPESAGDLAMLRRSRAIPLCPWGCCAHGTIPVNSWAQSLCTHGVRVLKMILALGHDECYRLERCCERRSNRGPGDEIT